MLKYNLSVIYGVAEHWVHRITGKRLNDYDERLTLIFNVNPFVYLAYIFP